MFICSKLFKQIIDLLLEKDFININKIINDICLSSNEIEEYCYLNKGKLNKNDNIISIKEWINKV